MCVTGVGKPVMKADMGKGWQQELLTE